MYRGADWKLLTPRSMVSAPSGSKDSQLNPNGTGASRLPAGLRLTVATVHSPSCLKVYRRKTLDEMLPTDPEANVFKNSICSLHDPWRIEP